MAVLVLPSRLAPFPQYLQKQLLEPRKTAGLHRVEIRPQLKGPGDILRAAAGSEHDDLHILKPLLPSDFFKAFKAPFARHIDVQKNDFRELD